MLKPVSESRRAWQKFKADHPKFVASRGAKANLGPKLDQLAKLSDAWVTRQVEANKIVTDLIKATNEMQAALGEYEKVAAAAAKEDPAVAKDFQAVKDDFNQIAKAVKMVQDGRRLLSTQTALLQIPGL